jgi:uncharacterized protein (TIGR02246 family)
MRHRFSQALVIVFLLNAGRVAGGQDATSDVDDTAKIEAAIQSYVTAFNARDVDVLVGHWSPDGVYISKSSGDQIIGREAMTQEFAAMFAGEGVPKIAVVTDSIEFISPNVALERGNATVTHAEDDVVESTYSVVYVKRDGKWLIDRVTDDEAFEEISHYEKLQALEWLIGEWVDEGDGLTIEIAARWTKNQNYISRTYTVSRNGEAESSGLQVIGWDPKQKQIRSWLFDSSGAHVTGTWTERDGRWLVSSVATLADGSSGSFTSVFRPLEDGTYGWQKINRVVDGQLLPNIDETIVRKK